MSNLNQVTQVQMDKKNHIWTGRKIVTARNIQHTIDTLNCADVSPVLSVTWKVYQTDHHTTPRINKTMLRRANKIAAGIGREVTSFDQLDGVSFGVVLI